MIELLVSYLESLEQIEYLIDGHGWVGRVIVDTLEVAVGFILHLSWDRPGNIREYLGDVACTNLFDARLHPARSGAATSSSNGPTARGGRDCSGDRRRCGWRRKTLQSHNDMIRILKSNIQSNRLTCSHRRGRCHLSGARHHSSERGRGAASGSGSGSSCCSHATVHRRWGQRWLLSAGTTSTSNGCTTNCPEATAGRALS